MLELGGDHLGQGANVEWRWPDLVCSGGQNWGGGATQAPWNPEDHG